MYIYIYIEREREQYHQISINHITMYCIILCHINHIITLAPAKASRAGPLGGSAPGASSWPRPGPAAVPGPGYDDYDYYC